MLRNVDKRLKSVNQRHGVNLKFDIYTLQIARNQLVEIPDVCFKKLAFGSGKTKRTSKKNCKACITCRLKVLFSFKMIFLAK